MRVPRIGCCAVLATIAIVASCTDGAETATTTSKRREAGVAVVMDDFESGALTDWQTVSGGAGGWFVYGDGLTAPDATQTDPNVPFVLADPPQGEFAAVTDMAGPGTRILYRDVKLDGRFTFSVTVFYSGSAPFRSPETLDFAGPEPNQQFRIDFVGRSAPIDSVASRDVLVNVFHTSPGDPTRLQPTEVSVDLSPFTGHTVRLRLTATDNGGPLRAGVDSIRFTPVEAGGATVEFPATEVASSAIDLVLHRMSEADALAALSAEADALAETDDFSGALLVARDGNVLLEDAWGLADRESGAPNTTDTQFRIGSMNKMFTAVAVLQLVEAGKLALDDPIGTYLRDYPNPRVLRRSRFGTCSRIPEGRVTSLGLSSHPTASNSASTATM
jgi:hypothetical protein